MNSDSGLDSPHLVRSKLGKLRANKPKEVNIMHCHPARDVTAITYLCSVLLSPGLNPYAPRAANLPSLAFFLVEVLPFDIVMAFKYLALLPAELQLLICEQLQSLDLFSSPSTLHTDVFTDQEVNPYDLLALSHVSKYWRLIVLSDKRWSEWFKVRRFLFVGSVWD